jgi:hypothetical protein
MQAAGLAAWLIQFANADRSRSMPWRASTRTWRPEASVYTPAAIGRAGAGVSILSVRQRPRRSGRHLGVEG